MSAPGIGKEPHFTLPDLDSVSKLPKPIKAVVYLIIMSVLTVAALGALMATIAIIGQLSGAFDIFRLLG
ncbi:MULTISPECIES: hypothetical protein [Saccharopolyspora]|jgi:hypothetical protein|uniref:Uncharacterized protein n=3 Tax=Saccharopolyspora TaxID=1835 RepID=A0A4R4VEQ8_9PSEU|nr:MULTISPECIES: hypothetical protein [Saccharopolyspora]MBQ0926092.1 hypothetical protein [Saccharopolyspora endophytica]TDD00544.1 hypothetical protein E1181_27355 [Saccharopolyspora terrae]TDD92380.1 hypothetical protein E1202_03265 [Saccharopolyspora karakumensis]